MKKRIIALLVVFSMMIIFVVPTTSEAAPSWWKKFINVVLEDVRGGLDGYDETGTLGGAIGGAVERSIDAGMSSGQGAGRPYSPPSFAEESIGLHHNMALKEAIGDQRLSELKDDEINQRITDYLQKNDLYKRDPKDKEMVKTQPKWVKISDNVRPRIEDAFVMLLKTGDSIREGEDPIDVAMKAVDDIKDGIREEVRNELEKIPFRKLQEIIEKQSQVELKDGEKLIYTIEGKEVLPDDIAYLISASILEHSFDFWGGNDIDEDSEPLQLRRGWLRKLWDIVKADISGAITGYNLTNNVGGAIIVGGLSSAFAGINEGAGQGNWEGRDFETIGSLHNKALTVVYGAEDMPQAMLNFLEVNNIEVGDKGKAVMKECVPPDGCIKDIDLPWPLGPKKTIKINSVSDEFNANLENVMKIAFEEEEKNFDKDKIIKELEILLDEAAKSSGTKPMILKVNEYEEVKASLNAEKKPYDIIYASMFIDMYAHSIAYWLGEEDTGVQAIGGPVDEDLERLLEILDLLEDLPESPNSGPGEVPDDTATKEVVAITLNIGSDQAKINNKLQTMDVKPIIMNQRTLVPFRFIGEALNAKIDWIPENREATYELGDVKLSVFIGENRILVNGKEMEIDVKPLIMNQRTLVPIRVISEMLGFEVEWYPEEQEVRVFSK